MTYETRSPRRALLVLAALAVTACQLPTKIGDLPGTGGDSTEGEPTPETGEATEIAASASETGGSETGATTGAAPSPCPGYDEAACSDDPACEPLFGELEPISDCGGGDYVFVICRDKDLDCPEGETSLCVGDESYHVAVDCAPPGTVQCEGKSSRCGLTPCLDLSEEDCGADDLCKAVYGNPHVEGEDGVCVDTGTSVYLGCIEDTGACPPFIPTVCLPDQPGQKYEVPSGCLPPDAEQCDPPAPQCP